MPGPTPGRPSHASHADQASHLPSPDPATAPATATATATADDGPGPSRRGVAVDAVIAAAVMFFATTMDTDFLYAPPVTMPGQELPPSWLRWVLVGWALAVWAVLAVRRRVPGVANVALPVLLAVHLAALPTGYASFVVTAFTVHHLGRFVPRKWFIPVWGAVAAGVLVALTTRSEYLMVQPEVGLALTPVALAVLGFFWMLGLNGRRRDQELLALRDRAELAAIAERTRIAREMHDIVAHSLTAVIAQADGGRFIAAKHPDKAVEALENIASTARDSLGQMRQLLSVLRDPADAGTSGSLDDDPAPSHITAPSDPTDVPPVPYTPMPGLDALPQLVAESTRSGLRVRMSEEGERPAVGATMQLTIYRIVQESLTNALKHAGQVAVEVVLEWGKRGCTVTVRNEAGPGNVEVEASQSNGGTPRIGRGITGMRERVALHGGTLDVDDEPGGFTVTARLPKG
ncbi:histidine kinase [Corynebacterium sp. NPDC060344]|uniref:histidine kinase n=1 Tax=Corynebacterium sp. NPDC060344 TaxID=3347101 RepID=UPI003656E3D0